MTKSAFVRNLITNQVFLNAAISGSLFLAVIALEDRGHDSFIIGTARAAIGCVGIVGALSTGLFQRWFSFPVLMLLNAACIAVALAGTALLSGHLWLVLPLGAAVIFAPAANAVVYAKMHELIPEEAFGRATNIQLQIVTGVDGIWTTPLSYISKALSLSVGMWVCTGMAAVGFVQTFVFNRATRLATEKVAAEKGAAEKDSAGQKPAETAE
ncbi:MAG: hypothetical protein Q4A82_07230 [Corynebacterium sp.]|nr:hypothetical protein [Corynebacterium sp.]